MSIQAVAWALKQDVKPAIAKLLLIAIANYVNEGKKCWPANATLAKDCSYDKDNLRKVLRQLEEQKLIKVKERWQGTSQLSNIITVNMDGGEGADTSEGEGADTLGEGEDTQGGESVCTPRGRVSAPTKPSLEPSVGTTKDKHMPGEPGESAGQQLKGTSQATPEEFESWYKTYPRRVARGQAEKAYRTARKLADAGTLLAGAKQAAERYAATEAQFIPYPASWLNGKRWLDEPSKPAIPHSPLPRKPFGVALPKSPMDFRDQGGWNCDW